MEATHGGFRGCETRRRSVCLQPSKMVRRVGRPRSFRQQPGAETTCKEGLLLLERLAGSGQWVPLSIIKGFLQQAAVLERARAMLVAQASQLEHALTVLTQAGASVCETDPRRGSLLHEAIKEKDLERVKFLLEHEPTLIRMCMADGTSPIHKAAEAETSHIECLLLLIKAEKKFDTLRPVTRESRRSSTIAGLYRPRRGYETGVNARDLVGQTPIFRAAAFGDAAAIAVLAAEGADVDAMRFLDGWRPLHAAAERGSAASVRELVRAGASVNKRSPDGSTPLQLAVSNNEKDAVAALLQLGAHPNVEDADGWTPLLKAAVIGDAELVGILIKAGAERNSRTVDGRTPLELARTEQVRKILMAK